MDMGVVQINHVTIRSGTLLFRQPLTLVPRFNGREVVLQVPELGLCSFGMTKKQAMLELAEDMMWMWTEYGLAPDGVLGEDAIKLKRALREIIKETQVR